MMVIFVLSCQISVEIICLVILLSVLILIFQSDCTFQLFVLNPLKFLKVFAHLFCFYQFV